MTLPVDIAARGAKWTINVDLQGLFKTCLLTKLLFRCWPLVIVVDHHLEARVRVGGWPGLGGAQRLLGVVKYYYNGYSFITPDIVLPGSRT